METNIMVSVILPVYNTELNYLKPAIDSILNQTYRNFELIIIDDASNDETLNILNDYLDKDKRIKLIQNRTNQGITKNLNVGIKLSRGKYIARMDADDISEKNRLEKQVYYMETHPDVIVLGCCARLIGNVSEYPNLYGLIGTNFKEDWETRRIRLLFNNDGVLHPTAFLRKDVIYKYKLFYDEKILKAQDYELWSRCIEYGKIEILPEILLKYRIHKSQISTLGKKNQKGYKDLIRINLLRNLGEFSETEKKVFLSLADLKPKFNKSDYHNLLYKMFTQNKKANKYNMFLFKGEIRLKLALLYRQKGLVELIKEKQFYYPSTLYYFINIKLKEIIRKNMVKKLSSKVKVVNDRNGLLL